MVRVNFKVTGNVIRFLGIKVLKNSLFSNKKEIQTSTLPLWDCSRRKWIFLCGTAGSQVSHKKHFWAQTPLSFTWTKWSLWWRLFIAVCVFRLCALHPHSFTWNSRKFTFSAIHWQWALAFWATNRYLKYVAKDLFRGKR